MANDTNKDRVREILGRNYDGCSELKQFVQTANAVVDQAVTKASAEGESIAASTQTLMKTWMAAYYYTKMDPTYKSKSTLGASGSFNSSPDDYLKGATDLDPSGWLEAIVKKSVAGAVWVGKTESEQLTWEERN